MTSPVLLVVDDDPDALVIIQDWLRFQLPKVTVHTATSSTAALEHIKDHDYDAIISDIRMPGMDGLELTTKVLECRPNTPVLLMTAHGDRDLGVKALHTGAYAYVLKPIDREYLMAWIIRAIDVRQLSRDVDRQRQALEQKAAALERANQALMNEIAQHQQTEQRLRESETRFRVLVEQVKDYAILMIDLDGRVVSWNAGAQMLKGYQADEIIGQSLSRFYTAEDIQRDRPGHLLKMAAQQGRVEDEGWRVRKDGSRFWANVVLTALHDEAGKLYGYTKITRDMTQRRPSQPFPESTLQKKGGR